LSLEVSVVRPLSTSFNVVGILPGSDPKLKDEAIVIGAHYDHLGRGGEGSLAPREGEIHHGADDNASGSAGLLELARMLTKQPAKPRRTIVFIAFSGEEEGLLGSEYFVQHSPVPLKKIVGMINLDMVGRIRTPTQMQAERGGSSTAPATTQDDSPILYVGGAGTAGAFDAIVKDADARSPLQIKNLSRGGIGPSDHMSFALKKIPVSVAFPSVAASYAAVAIIAHLIWNEPFGWPQLGGLVLIGGGILLIHQH